MSGDDKQYQHRLLVLTDHALIHADSMPMKLELAHAPLLTKIFKLIDDDEHPKPRGKHRICTGVSMDSNDAHLISMNLLGGQEEGIEHIALDKDDKAKRTAADVSYTTQVREQDRRHNVVVYDVNMANDLLELAAAVANEPDSPEQILAHLDTYNNFSATAEATLTSIKNTATEAWQGRTSAAVDALKRFQPKGVADRDLPPAAKPRNFRTELDGEFGLLQHNLDGMKNCIDTERETIAHLPHHELTKECWALASQYLEEAKAHAAEWQRSIRLPPQRGPSGEAGRAGGS